MNDPCLAIVHKLLCANIFRRDIQHPRFLSRRLFDLLDGGQFNMQVPNRSPPPRHLQFQFPSTLSPEYSQDANTSAHLRISEYPRIGIKSLNQALLYIEFAVKFCRSSHVCVS